MRRASFEDIDCSVAQTLEATGDAWGIMIIREAFLGTSRFDAFAQALGIARNTLTQRLDHLVRSQVLERVRYSERPPRDEYRLTERGRDLWMVITALRQWGDRWAAPAGPALEVVHVSCGHASVAVPHCSACGEELNLDGLQPVINRP